VIGGPRIGIDVGGTKIEGILMVGPDQVLRERIDTPRDDYDATIEAIAALAVRLETHGGGRATVGVGIPGSLSRPAGVVKNANSVWLLGQPLQADLERRLRRDIRVANDANCFAMSEATDGAAAGAEVVFAVIAGTGVGAGIVVRGAIVEGRNGIAGEWGHNPLPSPRDDERPGPSCYCGRHGCIETFLSGPALARDFEQATGRRQRAEEIVAGAAAGDPQAEAALGRYEDRMARGLAGIINVIDPDVIVLGGGMSNIDRLYERVPRLWSQYIFTCGGDRAPAPHQTPLRRARHGDSSGVRGAAWLWNAI
jgi:fructokinase